MRGRFVRGFGLVVAAGAVAAGAFRDDLRAGEPGPKVVAAWAAGPFEARVAFDGPVGDALPRAVVGRPIAFDESRPSARSKPTLSPAGPTTGTNDSRGSLRVAAARLEDGGRTLVLTTDPHPRAATYTLELPALAPGRPVRVEYDLTGVEVAWEGAAGANGSQTWAGWWPSLDPEAAREALRGSAGHERGFTLIARPGKLTLSTLVNLSKGSQILQVDAPAPLDATLGGVGPETPRAGTAGAGAPGSALFRVDSTGEPNFLSLAFPTGKGDSPLRLRLTTRTPARGTARPLDRDRQLLPWVPPTPPAPGPLENVPDLSGGDPRKGALVFASAEAKCASCHKVRGEGGVVGPDLSGQVGRDRKDVYRDIYEPSARVHPDYASYTLALKDGRVLVGTVRAEGADAVRVTDTEAKAVVVPRGQIEELRPSATSVMPVGLAGAIGEPRLRDLIAFLTGPPPR